MIYYQYMLDSYTCILRITYKLLRQKKIAMNRKAEEARSTVLFQL